MTVTGTDTGDRGSPKPTELPVEQLKDAIRELGQALMVRTLEKAGGQVEGLTQRINDAAGDGAGTGAKMAATGAKKIAQGESPLKAGVGAGVTGAKDKVKKAVGGGGDGGGKSKSRGNPKVVNIVEEFDVGLPRRVAYDQWTQFADYPSFTKKVESVEQESDEKINWRAQIFLSHRNWESTIVEQIPDERIVWKSKGAKGYVDGAVTFHELAPTMTRVLLVAEYHPDGFFEKTANLWRAQGRRLRLDFKNIKRHMMTQTLLNQEETEGWRGEIRDGEVVKTHEDALKEEESQKQETGGQEETDQEDKSQDAEAAEDGGETGEEEKPQDTEAAEGGEETGQEEKSEDREKATTGG